MYVCMSVWNKRFFIFFLFHLMREKNTRITIDCSNDNGTFRFYFCSNNISVLVIIEVPFVFVQCINTYAHKHIHTNTFEHKIRVHAYTLSIICCTKWILRPNQCERECASVCACVFVFVYVFVFVCARLHVYCL